MLAAHADWSIDAGKRFICIATARRGGWLIDAPKAVGPVGSLLSQLRERAHGAPVALGLDVPLGLPRCYASQLKGPRDFLEFLRNLQPDSMFFDVCPTLDLVSLQRPFYPTRGIKGMTRMAHARALGMADAAGLSRLCDRATSKRPAGAPIFWTLGANQTGKAAISAWRDMILPGLAADTLRLWPFEGDLRALLAPDAIVCAETYPAESLRQLGLELSGSKRRQTDRAALSDALHGGLGKLGAEPSADLAALIRDGFGNAASGEDQLDSLLGVLNVIAVVDGYRSDSAPADQWIKHWEGWVLGQSEMPLSAERH
jgi:hypothetical protein